MLFFINFLLQNYLHNKDKENQLFSFIKIGFNSYNSEIYTNIGFFTLSDMMQNIIFSIN